MKYIMVLLLMTQMSFAQNTDPESNIEQSNTNTMELKKGSQLSKKTNNPNLVTVFCSCDLVDKHGEFLSASISIGKGKDQEEAQNKAVAHCETVAGPYAKAYNCTNTKTEE